MIIDNLPILKIHQLTKEQYDRARDAGNLELDSLYLTPYEANPMTLVVSLYEDGEKTSHSSSEIYEHIQNGGSAVIDCGTSYIQIFDCSYGCAVAIARSYDQKILVYEINNTKNYAVREFEDSGASTWIVTIIWRQNGQSKYKITLPPAAPLY